MHIFQTGIEVRITKLYTEFMHHLVIVDPSVLEQEIA